jgi:N-acetylneuraminic acid mutarotase
VYLFGGHTGQPHQYHSGSQNGVFLRWNALDEKTLEILPGGQPLQSVALVSHDSHIYRIGGMRARNAEGKEADLESTADFARFDPARCAWESLAPLPAPRSSHDAATLGSQLWVAGGWKLDGASADATWDGAVLVADLSQQKPAWRVATQLPQKRRGLALAGFAGRLYVIGGMDEEGDLSKRVDVYDPKSNVWTPGPDLPFVGFGVAAVVAQDKLYVSGRDGELHELAGDRWQRAAAFQFPRYFHRIVGMCDGSLVSVGGTGHGGAVRVIERLELASACAPAETSFTIPFPGKAKNRQGVFLSGTALYLFGGNDSTKQHDFGEEHFTNEGWKVNLRTLQIAPIANYPTARQSMLTAIAPAAEHAKDGEEAKAVVGANAKRSTKSDPGLLIGGFGFSEGRARTLSDIYQYSFDDDRFTPMGALPQPRSQAGLVESGGDLWLFGGWDHDPKRPKEDASRYFTDVLRFTPMEGSLASSPCAAKIPRIRRAFGGALLGDRYYMIGGLGDSFDMVEICDVYDFARGTFDTIPAPATVRVNPEVCALNGKLYMFGGTALGGGDGGRTVESLEEFDPATRGWRTVADRVAGTTPQTRMFASAGRLLFATTNDPKRPALTITWLDVARLAAPTSPAMPKAAAAEASSER